MLIRSLFRQGRSCVSHEEAFLFDMCLSTLLQLPITAKSEIEHTLRFMERWRDRLRRWNT